MIKLTLKAGKFLTMWFRDGFVDTRLVGLDGSLGSLDQSRSFGPDAGDPTMSYNPGTGTTLLFAKYGPACDAVALQLGNDGHVNNLDEILVLSHWDGKVLRYDPWIAADPINKRWLVLYAMDEGYHASIVRWSAP